MSEATAARGGSEGRQAFRSPWPHHLEGALEGTLLLLGARVLEERCEVPEEGQDVRPLLEGTSNGIDAVACGVRAAWGRPAIRERTNGSAALAKKLHRLLGRQQRRDGAHGLEVLPADDAIARRLGQQPLRAHEDHIFAFEHFGEPIVQTTEDSKSCVRVRGRRWGSGQRLCGRRAGVADVPARARALRRRALDGRPSISTHERAQARVPLVDSIPAQHELPTVGARQLDLHIPRMQHHARRCAQRQRGFCGTSGGVGPLDAVGVEGDPATLPAPAEDLARPHRQLLQEALAVDRRGSGFTHCWLVKREIGRPARKIVSSTRFLRPPCKLMHSANATAQRERPDALLGEGGGRGEVAKKGGCGNKCQVSRSVLACSRLRRGDLRVALW